MGPRVIRTPTAEIALGVTEESGVLDFKEAVDGWNAAKTASNYARLREDAAKEVCRDLAQFANDLGGTVVIGIAESREAPDVAHAIAPVRDVDKLTDWISKAVVNYLVPSTITYDMQRVELEEGSILAISVRPHADLVAVYDRSNCTIQYVKRQGKRKRYLNPDEAMAEQMNTARMARVRLNDATHGGKRIHIRLGRPMLVLHREPTVNYQPYVPKFPPTIKEIGEDTFTIWSMGPEDRPFTIALPYGCIEHIWYDGLSVGLVLSFDLVFCQENKVGNARYEKHPEVEWLLTFEARR